MPIIAGQFYPTTGYGPTGETFAIVDAWHQIDGLRNVDTLNDMHNIYLPRRRKGMIVGVGADNSYWRLKEDVGSVGQASDWELVNLSSNTGVTTTFLDLTDTVSEYNEHRILFEGDTGVTDSANFTWDTSTLEMNDGYISAESGSFNLGTTGFTYNTSLNFISGPLYGYGNFKVNDWIPISFFDSTLSSNSIYFNSSNNDIEFSVTDDGVTLHTGTTVNEIIDSVGGIGAWSTDDQLPTAKAVWNSDLWVLNSAITYIQTGDLTGSGETGQIAIWNDDDEIIGTTNFTMAGGTINVTDTNFIVGHSSQNPYIGLEGNQNSVEAYLGIDDLGILPIGTFYISRTVFPSQLMLTVSQSGIVKAYSGITLNTGVFANEIVTEINNKSTHEQLPTAAAVYDADQAAISIAIHSAVTYATSASTFIHLIDTIDSYTANRILVESANGVIDYSGLTFDGSAFTVGENSKITNNGELFIYADGNTSNRLEYTHNDGFYIELDNKTVLSYDLTVPGDEIFSVRPNGIVQLYVKNDGFGLSNYSSLKVTGLTNVVNASSTHGDLPTAKAVWNADMWTLQSAITYITFLELADTINSFTDQRILYQSSNAVVDFSGFTYETGTLFTVEGSVEEGYNTTASGTYSHAEGSGTIASGDYSHAEGTNSRAEGNYSHVEGQSNISFGVGAHAEGIASVAAGDHSHAEGFTTKTIGDYSHSEGENTTASGRTSHAEGYGTHALGDYSHSEGYGSTAYAIASHAEGSSRAWDSLSHAEGSSIASGITAHSEGSNTRAIGPYTHAEGLYSTATGWVGHAEGTFTTASGWDAHAQGSYTIAAGGASHAEGGRTLAAGKGSHAEGSGSTSYGFASHSEGQITVSSGSSSHSEGFNTTASGEYSHSEGTATKATGRASHAEGAITTASGIYSHAEGVGTTAWSGATHAEGAGSKALGNNSHAEGWLTVAVGTTSHSEGRNTTAIGGYSHAEGYTTKATGYTSHAEGIETVTIGDASHAEGANTTAYADYSHSEGHDTTAFGDASHVEGSNTTTYGDSTHAEGKGSYAWGTGSHAEGMLTRCESELGGHTEGFSSYVSASAWFAHAEGWYTSALGTASHTEGYETTAIQDNGHAEGSTTLAYGRNTHAEGTYTTASGRSSHSAGINTVSIGYAQYVVGGFNERSGYDLTQADDYSFSGFSETSWANIIDENVFIIGAGSGITHRQNALSVTWRGNVFIKSGLTFSFGEYANEISDDENLTDASHSALVTEWAIKTYIDDAVISGITTHSATTFLQLTDTIDTYTDGRIPYESGNGTGGEIVDSANLTFLSNALNIGNPTYTNHQLNVAGDVAIGNAFDYTPSSYLDFVVGSSNGDSRFLFGQSNSSYGGMTWNYNATASAAYLSIGGTNDQDHITMTQQDIITISGDTVTIGEKLYLNKGVGVNDLSNDATLADASQTALVTEYAIKQYIDNSTTNITYIDSGTTQGQMMFWSGASDKWTYTETDELIWDDENKRLGINIIPNYDLDVQGIIGINNYGIIMESADIIRFGDVDGGAAENVILQTDSQAQYIDLSGVDDELTIHASDIFITGVTVKIGENFILDKGTQTVDEIVTIVDASSTDEQLPTAKSVYDTIHSGLTDGTADGQLMYWNATNSQWVHTETNELIWNDSTNRFGVKTASPGYDFHLTGDAYVSGRLYNNDVYWSGTLDVEGTTLLRLYGSTSNLSVSSSYMNFTVGSTSRVILNTAAFYDNGNDTDLGQRDSASPFQDIIAGSYEEDYDTHYHGFTLYGENRDRRHGKGHIFGTYAGGSNYNHNMYYLTETEGLGVKNFHSFGLLKDGTSEQWIVNIGNLGLIPQNNGQYDLGSTALQWGNLYVTGNAYIDRLYLTGAATYVTDIVTTIDGSSDHHDSPTAQAVWELMNNVSGLTSGTAQGQMLFWSAATNVWAYTETDELFWDDSSKELGIGTSSPAAPLHVNINTPTLARFQRPSVTGIIDISASGGDPQIIFNPEGGGQRWGVGVDDGLSDFFRIGITGSDLASMTSGITIRTGGGLGINEDSFSEMFRINAGGDFTTSPSMKIDATGLGSSIIALNRAATTRLTGIQHQLSGAFTWFEGVYYNGGSPNSNFGIGRTNADMDLIVYNDNGVVQLTSGLTLENSYFVNELSNDDTLADASTTALVTEYAIKQYVDNHSGGVDYVDSGTTQGQMLFWSGASDKWTFAETNELFWDDLNKRMGVRASNPSYTLEVKGSFGATTKSFIIDHPTKPEMTLEHGSLEGPEHAVYHRGRLNNGTSVIELPDYWEGLVDLDTITVNLTPIGKHQNLFVKRITYPFIKIESVDGEIDCYYTAFAERKDIEKLIVEK